MAEEEVEWTATTLRYYAELGRHERGRVIPSGEARSQLTLVLKEPYGVVGCIVPWNFPLLLLAWKLAPAKVERHLADARERGARIVTGGARPTDPERGHLYAPTVLTDVDHDMVIMREETFGPAIPVMSYGSIDKAIALVNDSPYGLGATLRSSDPALCKRFFEEVKVGTVWINDPLTDTYAGPFGGMGLTGGARVLGEEGLDTFIETKHVHWDFDQAAKEWWYPY